MLPLLQELGLNIHWEVIQGEQNFFEVTKHLHNALHGRPESLSQTMKELYWQTQETNSQHLQEKSKEDRIFFIHDPQPAGLIRFLRRPDAPWIFRCHVDVSSPFEPAWNFLHDIIKDYDASVFSHPSFAQKLTHSQFLITPSIDPLADKNKLLPDDFVQNTLAHFGIDPSRPLITQVSRFDKLKDPLGVIAAYRLTKRTHPDVQLLLAGGSASDDPESAHILSAIQEASSQDPDIHILDLPPFSDLEINALQRGGNGGGWDSSPGFARANRLAGAYD